uniref:Uncharacterized protein n=1 Tax=Columba livia TaxID=8932 RepID=R7VVZ9_COLLI
MVELSDSSDRGQWQHVPARHRRRRVPAVTTPPSQIPLHNSHEALQVQPNNNMEEDGSTKLKVPQRTSRSAPSIKTAAIKKKKMGRCHRKGTEGSVCRPDPLLREVWCLPGARVKDMKRKLPVLERPSDYFPLLIFQVGSNETAIGNPKAIIRDFRALGGLVKGSGAQVVFSSAPLVAGYEER